MSIQLSWDTNNPNADGTRIYRSEVPEKSPSPETLLVTLDGTTNTYIDATVEQNKVYYYRFGVFKGEEEVLSSVYGLADMPNTGPGPQTPLRGDYHLGYFGKVPVSEMFGAGDLLYTLGLPITDTIDPNYLNHWLKFVRRGKILFTPETYLSSSLSWKALYNAGAVYGVNGPGPFDAGEPVNQYRTITKDGNTYLIRLIEGTVDPSTLDSPTVGSEYDDLIPACIRKSSYNSERVIWDHIASSDIFRSSNFLTQSVRTVSGTTAGTILCRGAANDPTQSTAGGAAVGYRWFPVLELVL